MARYRLTNTADRDFARSFDFGIDTFGLRQARRYHRDMIKRFELIAQTPLLYPVADHVQLGLRRSVFQSHSIYYRIAPDVDEIVIVRILGRQNINDAFLDEDV